MTYVARVALAQRLERAELELQAAVHGLDGSPAARTRLARARAEYREPEQLVLAVLGARDAPAQVEAQKAVTYDGAPPSMGGQHEAWP